MASYDSLSISVEQLRAAVIELNNIVKAYETALTTYKENATIIQKSWDDGESGIIDAFKTKYDAASPKLDELSKSLTELHSKMDGYAEGFATAEQTALNYMID